MKKVLFFLCFLALTTTLNAQLFGKKDAGRKIAKIVRHPDEISLKGEKGASSFYFFVTEEGLFFTESEKVWWEISQYLPALSIAGRVVELEGTPINPFTKFNKKQLATVSERAGRKIKKYNVFRVSGHSLIQEDQPMRVD